MSCFLENKIIQQNQTTLIDFMDKQIQKNNNISHIFITANAEAQPEAISNTKKQVENTEIINQQEFFCK